MKTHELKCWPEFFKVIKSGVKTFEIRENDRDFKVGDELKLLEFKPCSRCYGTGRTRDHTDMTDCGCSKPHGKYTGKKINVRVTYITDWEQSYSNVVMAICLTKRPR